MPHAVQLTFVIMLLPYVQLMLSRPLNGIIPKFTSMHLASPPFPFFSHPFSLGCFAGLYRALQATYWRLPVAAPLDEAEREVSGRRILEREREINSSSSHSENSKLNNPSRRTNFSVALCQVLLVRGCEGAFLRFCVSGQEDRMPLLTVNF
jgi:hypothetical protein